MTYSSGSRIITDINHLADRICKVGDVFGLEFNSDEGPAGPLEALEMLREHNDPLPLVGGGLELTIKGSLSGYTWFIAAQSDDGAYLVSWSPDTDNPGQWLEEVVAREGGKEQFEAMLYKLVYKSNE